MVTLVRMSDVKDTIIRRLTIAIRSAPQLDPETNSGNFRGTLRCSILILRNPREPLPVALSELDIAQGASLKFGVQVGTRPNDHFYNQGLSHL